MLGGSPVYGRFPVGVVFGHMRRDVEAAKFLNEVFSVVALVTTQGYSSGRAWQLLYHGFCRFTLTSARCCCDLGFDDQAATVLHQGMALIAELGFLVLTLTVEPGIRIGNGCMGVVFDLLALEVNGFVSATACRRRTILGFEALDRSPCLDQGAVNGEVLTGQQVLPLCLGKYA